eukprot:TRINITY_DN66561_c0_g1_i3.p2 TRINITY_DN66561_c0_g1~~TRINITY_DN66561_c0_g1_i3.p2  ORF type:complete len:116 (+),score=0.92 TRINITY_DN66561_c0_g1_i3:356-703(+)
MVLRLAHPLHKGVGCHGTEQHNSRGFVSSTAQRGVGSQSAQIKGVGSRGEATTKGSANRMGVAYSSALQNGKTVRTAHPLHKGCGLPKGAIQVKILRVFHCTKGVGPRATEAKAG